MKRRVVITGMGVVSPLGSTVDDLWLNLASGASGVRRISYFDPSGFTSQIAAEVTGFEPTDYIEKKELRRMDLAQQYAIVAGDQAVAMAGLKSEDLDLDRCGVVIGSGIGGIATFEKQHALLLESGPNRVSPFFIPMMIADMCAGLISIRLGYRGPNYATVSACSSSGHAICDATRIIQRGEADVMVTGGSEAAITPTSLAGFCQAKALSTRNDDPTHASRPFDTGRDGFVIGEGAGIVVLEEYEYAKARGAMMFGELLGAGMSADAYHITAPHPEGIGARRAMESAIRDAGISVTDVNYVNTHGTSTGLGDIAEAKAIRMVFGDHADKLPCNSTKSMAGHLLGAAGAVELIASMLQIRYGKIHATTNLENPDPECDLDFVPEGVRDHAITYGLSNSFGFGGHNISIIFGPVM
jgi:3-oxoacyl-[acyl-carrier-protein] synthase II